MAELDRLEGDLLCLFNFDPEGGDFGRTAEASGELEPMNDSKPVSFGAISVGLKTSETLPTDVDDSPVPEGRLKKRGELGEKVGEDGEVLLTGENIF